MPATATHATQSEHEGPWRFWSESNEHPVAIWQDDEMKSALREIAAKKTNVPALAQPENHNKPSKL